MSSTLRNKNFGKRYLNEIFIAYNIPHCIIIIIPTWVFADEPHPEKRSFKNKIHSGEGWMFDMQFLRSGWKKFFRQLTLKKLGHDTNYP